MADRIQYRRGLASQWTSVNPVLANGEPGYETDTGFKKVGDGTTPWNSLPYMFGTIPAHVAAPDPHTQYLLKAGGEVTGTLTVSGPRITSRRTENDTALRFHIGLERGDGSGASGFIGTVGGGASNVAALTFHLGVGAPERARLLSTGEWGFNSPPVSTVPFRIQAPATNDVGLEWQRQSPTDGVILSYSRSAATYTSLAYDASTHVFRVLGADRMRIDADGNVGVGIVPSPWTGRSVVQVAGASLAGPGGNPDIAEFSANRYLASGVDRYIGTGSASVLQLAGGEFRFFSAGAGTAGGTIAFNESVRIGANGFVGINVGASAATRFHVTGDNTASTVVAAFNTAYAPPGSTLVSIGGFSNSAGGSTGSAGLRAYHNHVATTATDIALYTTASSGGLPADRLRAKSTGQVRFVPLSSAPSSPEEGDMYYDSTLKKFRGWDGTAWQNFH